MLTWLKRRHLLALWVVLLGFAFSQLHYSWFSLRWTNSHIVREVGLMGYFMYEAGSRVMDAIESRRPVDPTPYRTFLTERTQARQCSEQVPGPRPRKNVVFLQLESIDQLTLSAELDGAPVMPFLKDLSHRSLWFEQARDQTGIGRSADAHILALMSQIPIQNEAVFTRYDLSKVESLPRILGKYGYRTLSFESTQGEFWRWKTNHKRLGYDTSYAMADLKQDEILGWGVSDMSVVNQVLQYIESIEQPVFAHIVLLTHHHPFSFVRESLDLPSKGIVHDYLLSARYVDGVIKSLFNGLRVMGKLQNTLVAVYSDHDSGVTEELYEDMGVEYQEGTEHERIPLMLYTGKTAERLERYSGLVDLAPTVLHELNIDIPLSFVGTPAQCQPGDLLFQNNTRAKKNESGQIELVPLPNIDLGKLTRLAIERPEELLQ